MANHTEKSVLSHIDAAGRARMVAVGEKPVTARGAIARARVRMSAAAWRQVASASGAKGDSVQVARIAGIMAAKRCSELIPLCHPVAVVDIDVRAELEEADFAVSFVARVEACDRTGVEMEAMSAASVAALTLYDMIKSVDRAAEIVQVKLCEKWGGKSGHYVADVGP